MRNLLFALAFAVLAVTSLITPASAQSAEPGCNVHIGGVCGRDRVNWCNTWARTNHGRFAMPAECGEQRYGGIPQRRFYGGASQFRGLVIGARRTVTWHRHEEHHEGHTALRSVHTESVVSAGYVPPGFHIVH